MTSKHTPGPWGIEQTDDTNWIGFMRPDGRKAELIVCTTDRDSLTDEALERNDANARLIAAAPMLLEALESVPADADYGCAEEHRYRADLERWWSAVAAPAIAKAKGGV